MEKRHDDSAQRTENTHEGSQKGLAYGERYFSRLVKSAFPQIKVNPEISVIGLPVVHALIFYLCVAGGMSMSIVPYVYTKVAASLVGTTERHPASHPFFKNKIHRSFEGNGINQFPSSSTSTTYA